MKDTHVKMSTSRKRIAWIDSAKGIAMILVFYGHLGGSGDNPWFPYLEGSIWVIYLFHMPLFFVLSGLTFNPNKPFKTFLWSRIRRLVIPYFFFSLYAVGKILLLLVSPTIFKSFHANSMGSAGEELLKILLGNTQGLWFFLALFWADLFLYGLNKFVSVNRFKLAPILGMIVLMALFGWFAIYFCGLSTVLPFQLLRSVEGIAFVGLGWLLAALLKSMSMKQSIATLFFSAMLFACTAYWAFADSKNSPMLNVEIPYILAAIFGSFMVIALSQLLPNWRCLSYIGRNTMIDYGLNGLSMAMARKVAFFVLPVEFVASSVLLQYIVGLLVVTVACVICAIATPILYRWCWWGVGVTRPSSKVPVKHVAA